MRASARFAPLLALLALPAFLVAAPADAATPRDTMTVAGYDFVTEIGADVVAGSLGNNLVFTYTARSPLTDGTIVVDVPRSAWPQDLPGATGDGFDGSPTERGVVVRPAPPFAAGPGFCTGTAQTPLQWTVVGAADVQRIVVRHLTCAAGDRIYLRVRLGDDPAPGAGRYPFAVSVSDAAGAHRVTAPTLRVVPVPRVRLELTMPRTITQDQPFQALVRALRPDGRVATGYTGPLGLQRLTNNCSFEPNELPTYEMTPADAGVTLLTLQFSTPGEIPFQIFDRRRRAQPGVAGPYTVVVTDLSVECPVAFH